MNRTSGKIFALVRFRQILVDARNAGEKEIARGATEDQASEETAKVLTPDGAIPLRSCTRAPYIERQKCRVWAVQRLLSI
jgi:hypothetical protein